MSKKPMHGNGGDLLVRILRAYGVDTAFGVVSVHNLPLVEALDRELKFVPVRHEAAAVNAADGYARASGGLGVAITSTGTGAGNAAGAMIEAQTARSRVLHVTGQIDSEFLGSDRGVIHETRDQLGMLTAVSRHAATIHSVDEAADVLLSAVRNAVTVPFGPSSVEWPIDLQYAARSERIPMPVPSREPVAGPDVSEIDAVAEFVAAARRPLIWAGGGATGAGVEVHTLAERLNAGIVTSNSGRGTVPEDHELVIGNFATHPEVAPLLADADLLVGIGTHFRSNETKHYQLRLPSTRVQVDLDPAAIGRTYSASAGVTGDAAEVLSALVAALPEQPGTQEDWRARVITTRDTVRARLGEAIGPYLPICRALREEVPRTAVIARDVTIPSSQWGNRLLPIYHPRSNLFPVGGGIGQGLAMGIGAAAARTAEPTVVMAGDGGLAVHLGELATLAQRRPWLVVVLFNDGGYGVLRNMQDAHTGSRSGVDLYTPDFARLADSVGIPHRLVRTPPEFGEAFGKAVAEHGPSIVEVDVTALPAMPEPFVPPVPVPDR